MKQAIIYIDGLNLYYRALKGTKHRWLNLEALSNAVMPKDCCIQKIKYFTARVSGHVKPDAPKKQQAYLTALKSTPIVEIISGKMQLSKKWSGLVQPPRFLPKCTLPESVKLDVAYVWKTEEKGSDVNLGVHLVRDAAKGCFDVAGVLTNDTDLCSAIKMVREDFDLPVHLLCPIKKAATSLEEVSTSVRHVLPYLGPCHFDDSITLPNGKIIEKPSEW